MAYVPVRPKDPLIPVLPPPLFLPLFVCGFVYDKAKLVTACGVLTNIAEVYIATAFSHQDIAWVDVFIPCIMPFPTMFGPLNAILLKLPSPKPTVLNIAPNVASRMIASLLSSCPFPTSLIISPAAPPTNPPTAEIPSYLLICYII